MPLVPNYAPTDWVDGVTPVNEARMDNIDTNLDAHADAINTLDTRLAAEEAMPDVPTVVNGSWIKGVGGAMVWSTIAQADVTGLVTALAAKEATANKGVANGYAPLDGTSKVPAANLPTPIDLKWQGTYAGATAYKEGDVVISSGISYMALRPTTGETPAPWSSGAGAAAVGGWDAIATLATQQDTTSTTGTDIPGLVLPLVAGTTYEIDIFLEILSSTGGGIRFGIGYSGGGTATVEAYWSGFSNQNTANQTVMSGFGYPAQIWIASTGGVGTLSARGWVRSGSNPGNLSAQFMKVTNGTASVLVGSALRVRKAT